MRHLLLLWSVCSYGPPGQNSLVFMKTFVNRNLFAHGNRQGDVVRIVACSAHNIGDGGRKSVGGTTAALPTEYSCLVHQLVVNGVLALGAPRLDGLGDTDMCSNTE